MGSKRIVELDIFRGIAAISVVLFHYTSRYNIAFETSTMSLYEFSFGHYGVQLFFIISGFVIFMTLERSKTVLDFIKRRFIRLYPTFWICMILTFIITSSAGIARFERTFADLLVNTTMLPNLLGFKAVDGVYWSLEVELLFYFLMILLLKFNLLKFSYVLLVTWLFSGVLIHYFHIPYLNVFLVTGYSYLFVAGISFYRIWKDDSPGKFKYHVLISLCLVYGFAKDLEEGIIVLFSFTLFYLFVYNQLQFISKLLFKKPLIFLGNISYSLYLIHQFVGMSIIFHLSRITENYFLLLFIPILFSVLIAWAVTYFDQLFQPVLKKNLL